MEVTTAIVESIIAAAALPLKLQHSSSFKARFNKLLERSYSLTPAIKYVSNLKVITLLCQISQMMLSLILLLLCVSSFTAASGSSMKNIKVCVSFDKSHTSFLNIGWDGSEIGVEIVYNATGKNKTSVQYISETRMITSLKINDGFIGNNLTVQVGPSTSNRSLHNNTRSDPITLEVNYVHDVKWTRISTSHIQFNCTLACRSAINYCTVELNATQNTSSDINKTDFNSWAIVDFFLLDAHQAFTYTVYAQGSSDKVLGQRINGSIPPILLSIDLPITTSIMSKSEPSTVLTSTTSMHTTTTSMLSTQGNALSSTVTALSHTEAVDKDDESGGSTGLMIGVIITSLLVILLASVLLGVGLILWRQKKGKTSEVSSTKHITEAEHDAQNAASQNSGQTNIGINAYEEIVDVPLYSKPLSTSNAVFLQTEKVKHSSLSSKKSVSSQRSFESFQENLPSHVFDEKIDHNRSSENISSDSGSHSTSYSGSNIGQVNFQPESENPAAGQESSVLTENETKEEENPYFELIDLATKNYYENTSILPLKTSEHKESRKENDLEKPISVSGKCQTLPLQGLGSKKSQLANEPNIKRRSLNDYDEPITVDQVIDPTTGHTYTLPILRKKE